MQYRILFMTTLTAATLLSACGVTDTRDQVVYPPTAPIPRAAPAYHAAPAPHTERKTNYANCPESAEELAPGSICPPSAQCFEISGGRRCIVYAR